MRKIDRFLKYLEYKGITENKATVECELATGLLYQAKTGRLYSVKIEPEAAELIKRYRGTKWLLNVRDTYPDYLEFLRHMNRELKHIGPYTREGRGGKKVYQPLFPDISQYWCRHTWATIAAGLDIPKETIAAALGHSIGNPTTSIYIDFNQAKVDEANRRVLDFVFRGE